MVIRIFIVTSFIATLFWGCYKEKKYGQPLSPDLYNLSSEKDAVLADGVSTAKIIVEIPLESSDSNSKIELKTTNGFFVENGLKALTVTATKVPGKMNRIAEATLRSSINVTTAKVSIKPFDVQKQVAINFINSFPEKVKLSASGFSIKPSNGTDGEVSLEALITKAEGQPSVGNIIDVTGYDSTTTKTIGSFRIYNNQNNEAGKTNYVFVLGDSIANGLSKAYTGRLYLIARSLNSQNQFIRDTVKLISSR